MPRGAACGSALPVVPLSLLLVLRPPSHVRLCSCSTCSGAVGRAFPAATVELYNDRIAHGFVLVFLFRGASVNRGGRTCLPVAFTYLLELSQSKVSRFIVYVAMVPI